MVGFFGYGPLYGDLVTPRPTGEQQCIAGTDRHCGIRPPLQQHRQEIERGRLHTQAQLTYKLDETACSMPHGRPDSARAASIAIPLREPYTPDFLTNYEIGWKTSWLDHRLRLNGAIFQEKWKDAQFGVAGVNAITEIINAGRAKIKGIEADVQWRVGAGLTLSGSATYLDAKLTTNSCNYFNSQFDCSIPGPNGETNSTLAPAGTRLPVSPRFKMNAIARYDFDFGDLDAHVQGAAVYQGDSTPRL